MHWPLLRAVRRSERIFSRQRVSARGPLEKLHALRSQTAPGSSRRRSNFRRAAVRCLWYAEPNAVSNAVDYAKFRSRSHNVVIRVYDEAGNVIVTCSWHQPPFALAPRNVDRLGADRTSDQL